MTLELVVGPVRSGKLGVLLDRFAAACRAGARPLLLVPRGVRARCARTRRLPQRRRRAGRRGRHARHADRARARRRGRRRVRGARSRPAPARRARPGRGARPAAGRARLGARAPRARVRPRGRGAGCARACARRRCAARARLRGLRGGARRDRARPPRAARRARRRAARARARRLGRRARVRLRLRRPLARRSCACSRRSRGAATSCSRCRTSPGGRCSARSTSRSSGSPRAPSSVEELRAAAYGAPAERGRARARRLLGAQRAAAARGRRRPPRRGRRDGRRGRRRSPRRSAGCCASASRADEVLVVAPDGHDCEPLAAALERAGVDGRARHQRAPHEPARRARAARPLPRGLGGRRPRRPLRLAAPGGLELGPVAGARVRGAACARATSPTPSAPSASCWPPSRRGRCPS